MADDVVVLLRAIDAKLRAQLALSVEQQKGSADTKKASRPMDRLLADAGIPTREIAYILGKTDRAVRMVLQSTQKTPKSERPSKDQKDRDRG